MSWESQTNDLLIWIQGVMPDTASAANTYPVVALMQDTYCLNLLRANTSWLGALLYRGSVPGQGTCEPWQASMLAALRSLRDTLTQDQQPGIAEVTNSQIEALIGRSEAYAQIPPSIENLIVPMRIKQGFGIGTALLAGAAGLWIWDKIK